MRFVLIKIRRLPPCRVPAAKFWSTKAYEGVAAQCAPLRFRRLRWFGDSVQCAYGDPFFTLPPTRTSHFGVTSKYHCPDVGMGVTALQAFGPSAAPEHDLTSAAFDSCTRVADSLGKSKQTCIRHSALRLVELEADARMVGAPPRHVHGLPPTLPSRRGGSHRGTEPGRLHGKDRPAHTEDCQGPRNPAREVLAPPQQEGGVGEKKKVCVGCGSSLCSPSR